MSEDDNMTDDLIAIQEFWDKNNFETILERSAIEETVAARDGNPIDANNASSDDKEKSDAVQEYMIYLSMLEGGDYSGGILGSYAPSGSWNGTIKALKDFKSDCQPREGMNIVAEAQRTIGINEIGSSNRGVAEITGGIEGVPWCALYVSALYGDQLDPEWGVRRMMDQVESKGAFLSKDDTDQVQPGDIIFLANGNHVGIVKEIKDGKIYTIEGNSSNGVNERGYSMNSSEISGFGSFDKLQEFNIENNKLQELTAENKEINAQSNTKEGTSSLIVDYTKIILDQKGISIT
ncbi:MAG: CHAP domain-containing protein [Alphaproteobacteria bacterium]